MLMNAQFKSLLAVSALAMVNSVANAATLSPRGSRPVCQTCDPKICSMYNWKPMHHDSKSNTWHVQNLPNPVTKANVKDYWLIGAPTAGKNGTVLYPAHWGGPNGQQDVAKLIVKHPAASKLADDVLYVNVPGGSTGCDMTCFPRDGTVSFEWSEWAQAKSVAQ